MGSIEFILTELAGMTKGNVDMLKGDATDPMDQMVKNFMDAAYGKLPDALKSLFKLDSASIDHLGSAALSAKPEDADTAAK